MSAHQRAKGARIERALVALHHDAALPAEKVSRSGYPGPDLVIADQFTAEVKARRAGNGFVQLERWKGEADLLFVKRDRQAPLVVMDWPLYTRLLRAWLHQDGPDL